MKLRMRVTLMQRQITGMYGVLDPYLRAENAYNSLSAAHVTLMRRQITGMYGAVLDPYLRAEVRTTPHRRLLALHVTLMRRRMAGCVWGI